MPPQASLEKHVFHADFGLKIPKSDVLPPTMTKILCLHVFPSGESKSQTCLPCNTVIKMVTSKLSHHNKQGVQKTYKYYLSQMQAFRFLPGSDTLYF
jgi:hypothetical protein